MPPAAATAGTQAPASPSQKPRMAPSAAPTQATALQSDSLPEALAWAEANPTVFEELVVALATPQAVARWQQRRNTQQGLANHRPSLLQRPPARDMLSVTASPAAGRVSLLLYSAGGSRGGGMAQRHEAEGVPGHAVGADGADPARPARNAASSTQLSQGALARAVAVMGARSDAVLPLLLPLCGALNLSAAVHRVASDLSILFGSGHCQLFLAQDMGPNVPGRLLLMNPKPCNTNTLSLAFGEGLAGSAARDRKAIMLNSDVDQHPLYNADVDAEPDTRTKSLLVVPFSFEGDLIGVLEVVNRSKDGKDVAFCDDDERALRLYLSFAAAVLRLAETGTEQEQDIVPTQSRLHMKRPKAELTKKAIESSRAAKRK